MDRFWVYFLCFWLGGLFACNSGSEDSRDGEQEEAPLAHSATIVEDEAARERGGDRTSVAHSPAVDSSDVVTNELEKRYREMGLEDVREHIPEIWVDLKYSTSDNFLGFDVYGDLTTAYLQHDGIVMLKKAHALLREELPGHTFIIYDAARPASVQQKMWDAIDVPEHQKFWYVAPPGKGSLHNYGMAVDLTIADSLGRPLDLGTPFDHFGKLAYPRYTKKYLEKGELSNHQANNRALLIRIMHQAGFSVARTEWWHFNATSLENARERYPKVP